MADAELLAAAGQETLVQRPAPPSRQPRSVLFLAGSVVGGNGISTILRLVGGYFQARLVSPGVLGLFTGIGIVMGYVPFVQLGILHGLNRELPYYVAKGEHDRVRDLAAAAQAWAILVSTIAALAFLAVGGWYLFHGDLWMAAGWTANAFAAFVLFYNTNYLQYTYRTGHDFVRLSAVTVVQDALSLALVVLIAVWSFYGICLRAVISGLVGTALLYYWRPVRVGPKWNYGCLKHLLVIGAPIFLVAQFYTAWAYLDRTFVLGYTSDTSMGLYAMALMVGQTCEILPLAVMQVIYPRIAEQFGRTGKLEDVFRMAVKPMLLSALGMVPFVFVGWWLMRPVVSLLLPKYAAGVPAMQWWLLPPLLTSLLPVNCLFVVARRQDLYFAAMVLGAAAYEATLFWLIRDHVRLTAFPQAMLVGRTVFIAACFALISYLRRRESARTAIC